MRAAVEGVGFAGIAPVGWAGFLGGVQVQIPSLAIAVGGANYSCDENGNLTSDGRLRYYYDCENRLVEVNDVNEGIEAGDVLLCLEPLLSEEREK